MKHKTPSFWYRDSLSPAPLIERALSPASCGYAWGHKLHQLMVKPQKAAVPVICIGNLVAGGTGKTPTALALLEIIRKHALARAPHFLIRGYGGAEIGPLLVDPKKHSAWDTGDEALLLSRNAPTIVSPNRVAGAKMAVERGADLILMDDGLQNPSIHKDLKIAVLNGEMGFGNKKMLPAGPLRQPLEKGLKNVDVFILIGEDKRNILPILPEGKPVFHAALETAKDALPAKDKSYLAFAGLGYPQKFFTFLKEDLHLTLAGEIPFPDHYPYNEADLRTLDQKAKNLNAELLTTEKDILRLPKLDGIPVHVLPVHLKIQSEQDLAELLKIRLAEKDAAGTP